MFWQYLGAFLIAFGATMFLVPVNIRFSAKNGLIAYPNERSIHLRPIPSSGGQSFGLVSSILCIGFGLINLHQIIGTALLKLGVICLLLLFFGYIDDRYTSKVKYKLIWQTGVSLMMFFAGFKVIIITNPFGESITLGWLSLPVTILWFLLIMNSMNLIDGLDGLASGIATIVFMVLAVVGILEQNSSVVLVCLILIGANLAFLRYNFYPARIFMGDAGSLFLGLNIAAISTTSSAQYKGIATMTLIVPIIALAIPLIDTALAVFRRLGSGNIFKADKAHLHHYMLNLGFSQRTISYIAYFITFLFGLAAIGFSFTSQKVLFSLLIALLAAMIIIGYVIMHKGMKK